MDIFKDLYDTATGVLNKVIDFEFSKFELDLIKRAQADEAARNAANAPVSPAALVQGNTMLWLLIGGAVIVGGVLLLRR